MTFQHHPSLSNSRRSYLKAFQRHRSWPGKCPFHVLLWWTFKMVSRRIRPLVAHRHIFRLPTTCKRTYRHRSHDRQSKLLWCRLKLTWQTWCKLRQLLKWWTKSSKHLFHRVTMKHLQEIGVKKGSRMCLWRSKMTVLRSHKLVRIAALNATFLVPIEALSLNHRWCLGRNLKNKSRNLTLHMVIDHSQT